MTNTLHSLFSVLSHFPSFTLHATHNNEGTTLSIPTPEKVIEGDEE